MVFVVKSAPHHLVLRNAIRSTWASISSIQNKRLVTIFLVGKAVVGNRTQQLQEALERENSINGDILQCSSAESYKTLPSKASYAGYAYELFRSLKYKTVGVLSTEPRVT